MPHQKGIGDVFGEGEGSSMVASLAAAAAAAAASIQAPDGQRPDVGNLPDCRCVWSRMLGVASEGGGVAASHMGAAVWLVRYKCSCGVPGGLVDMMLGWIHVEGVADGSWVRGMSNT